MDETSSGKTRDHVGIREDGFIRLDTKSRKVYVIRRVMNGRNYKTSTRTGTLRANMKHLQWLEADPTNYNP